MTAYLLRRVLVSIPTLAALITLTFLLLRSVPGDPADARLAEADTARIDRAAVEHLRSQFGGDLPPLPQAVLWAGRCLRFDFGLSFADGAPVGARIVRALGATAVLSGTALLLMLAVSLTAGTWMAAGAGGRLDRWGGRLLLIAASVPASLGAVILQRLLAVDFPLFPLHGAGPPGAAGEPFLGGLRLQYLALPALCVAYRGAALYSRLVRQAVVQTLRAEFVTAARARGLAGPFLHLRHTLRNALLPLISTTAALVPAAMAGSIVVETIFGWPGAGRLFADSVLGRDYPVILALVWAGALLTLTSLLAADLLLGSVDPRVRVHDPAGRQG